jgi:hypothetical protein
VFRRDEGAGVAVAVRGTAAVGMCARAGVRWGHMQRPAYRRALLTRWGLSSVEQRRSGQAPRRGACSREHQPPETSCRC